MPKRNHPWKIQIKSEVENAIAIKKNKLKEKKDGKKTK